MEQQSEGPFEVLSCPSYFDLTFDRSFCQDPTVYKKEALLFDVRFRRPGWLQVSWLNEPSGESKKFFRPARLPAIGSSGRRTFARAYLIYADENLTVTRLAYRPALDAAAVEAPLKNDEHKGKFSFVFMREPAGCERTAFRFSWVGPRLPTEGSPPFEPGDVFVDFPKSIHVLTGQRPASRKRVDDSVVSAATGQPLSSPTLSAKRKQPEPTLAVPAGLEPVRFLRIDPNQSYVAGTAVVSIYASGLSTAAAVGRLAVMFGKSAAQVNCVLRDSVQVFVPPAPDLKPGPVSVCGFFMLDDVNSNVPIEPAEGLDFYYFDNEPLDEPIPTVRDVPTVADIQEDWPLFLYPPDDTAGPLPFDQLPTSFLPVGNQTALHVASRRGDVAAVAECLRNDAGLLERADVFGRTAIFYAAANGHMQIVCTLLEAGAATDRIDICGNVASDYARLLGHDDVTKVLIDRCLSYGAESDSDTSPFELALESSSAPASAGGALRLQAKRTPRSLDRLIDRIVERAKELGPSKQVDLTSSMSKKCMLPEAPLPEVLTELCAYLRVPDAPRLRATDALRSHGLSTLEHVYRFTKAGGKPGEDNDPDGETANIGIPSGLWRPLLRVAERSAELSRSRGGPADEIQEFYLALMRHYKTDICNNPQHAAGPGVRLLGNAAFEHKHCWRVHAPLIARRPLHAVPYTKDTENCKLHNSPYCHREGCTRPDDCLYSRIQLERYFHPTFFRHDECGKTKTAICMPSSSATSVPHCAFRHPHLPPPDDWTRRQAVLSPRDPEYFPVDVAKFDGSSRQDRPLSDLAPSVFNVLAAHTADYVLSTTVVLKSTTFRDAMDSNGWVPATFFLDIATIFRALGLGPGAFVDLVRTLPLATDFEVSDSPPSLRWRQWASLTATGPPAVVDPIVSQLPRYRNERFNPLAAQAAYLRFLRRFRTGEQCPIPACPRRACSNWHHAGDRRRPPHAVALPAVCPLLDCKDPEHDLKCHSAYERLYHPLFFKSEECRNGTLEQCLHRHGVEYSVCAFLHPDEEPPLSDETRRAALRPIADDPPRPSLKLDLRRLLERGTFCDVFFRVLRRGGGGQALVGAHRVVIAARCPAMEKVLRVRSLPPDSVIDTDIADEPTLRLFLEFLYTGELPASAADAKQAVLELLKLFDMPPPEKAPSLESDFRRALRRGDYADCVIKLAGGATRPVHRCLLAARSDYFNRLLSAGMAEGAKREVDLSADEPQLVDKVLRFLYTDALDADGDVAAQLLELADFYVLPRLSVACQNIIYSKEFIHSDNVVEFHQLAMRLGLEELREYCAHLLRLHFKQGTEYLEHKNDTFRAMSEDQRSQLRSAVMLSASAANTPASHTH